MIQKIISGGQTGVDRAALDAAIKLTIPHGGWIPQGRLTEDGPLPSKYQLKETRSTSYADRTEKNVLDADATLIISRGPLTGGSEYTREMAVKHRRLWLHIDLQNIPAFQAAIAINDWISKKGIAILNVAGPRASKDPKIYKDTLNIIESSYYLGLVQGGAAGDNLTAETARRPSRPPQNVDEAVERLISQMPLKDKATVANMSPDELPNLYSSLGDYILKNFGLLSGNPQLIESCRMAADGSVAHEKDAAAIIIEALWQKLRRTHKLRVIK
jgi:hypothetical protein